MKVLLDTISRDLFSAASSAYKKQENTNVTFYKYWQYFFFLPTTSLTFSQRVNYPAQWLFFPGELHNKNTGNKERRRLKKICYLEMRFLFSNCQHPQALSRGSCQWWHQRWESGFISTAKWAPESSLPGWRQECTAINSFLLEVRSTIVVADQK